MQFEKLLEQLQTQLEAEVPINHQILVDEFKDLIKINKYRAAYMPLHKLLHLGDWSPSNRLRGYIEKYKVVF